MALWGGYLSNFSFQTRKPRPRGTERLAGNLKKPQTETGWGTADKQRGGLGARGWPLEGYVEEDPKLVKSCRLLGCSVVMGRNRRTSSHGVPGAPLGAMLWLPPPCLSMPLVFISTYPVSLIDSSLPNFSVKNFSILTCSLTSAPHFSYNNQLNC